MLPNLISQRSAEKVRKKTDGLLERHRPKDGIPKEEEEKPRKTIVQETLLQCNSVLLCPR